MAEISRPELCIVGAGALGIALAQYARRLGAGVTLVDRGAPEPGDGPGRALRIAALMASASRAAAMRKAPEMGLGAGDPKISMKAVHERAQRIAADRAPLDSRERLATLGIEVVTGPVRFADAASLTIGETQIRPQSIVLALGGTPVVPAIPGLEEAGFFTPETLLENTRKLTHLLVIGADDEGLALAQAHARLGSSVTVVPQGRLLSGFDVETSGILLQALEDDGVQVMDGANVRAINPRSQGIGAVVDLRGGGEQALDVSHVLVCSGLAPDLDAFNLDLARIRPVRGQAGHYVIGDMGQTSNRKVRMVGIAAGIDQWPQALAHGRSVVEALVLGAPRRAPEALPRLIMTEPALAQIGHLPADTSKLSQGHRIHRANLHEDDMAHAQGVAGGLVKVLTNPKGRILGAGLVGEHAADLAGVLALAMDQGLALEDLAGMPLPYPSTLSSLVTMAQNQDGVRTVSSFARRRGTVMRLLRR